MNISDLTLPDLPYDYSALEPVISQKIMTLHHDKHHAGYLAKLQDGVKGSDVASMSLEDAFAKLSSLDSAVAKAVQNNGGGFYNHSLFWKVLTPNYKEPSVALMEKLNESFQSFEEFKKQFTAAAMGVFGSGWAWVIKDNSGALKITSTANQDNPLMENAAVKGTPVLGLDVWEHAYYIDYENRRNEYVENIFKIINWEQVETNIG